MYIVYCIQINYNIVHFLTFDNIVYVYNVCMIKKVIKFNLYYFVYIILYCICFIYLTVVLFYEYYLYYIVLIIVLIIKLFLIFK